MTVPQHVAIILDGNGRWAKAKGMPRSYGHIKGCANLESLCDDVKELGISYLTVYAFSTENWKRSRPEVDTLMKLFRDYLKRCIKISDRNEMRVKIIGDISAFDQDIQDAIVKLEEHVDIGGILELMREAGSGQSECRSAEDQESVPLQSVSDTCRRQSAFSAGRYLTLAVARDEAFCFYYKENLEMFRRRGVKIRWFSPLHDREIPEDADGLLLGGGYPENHLEELSRNRSMLESVRKAADRGLPSLAECGGFMYLHRTVEDMDGRRYEMVGAVDGECRYAGHLVRFGYMEIEAVNEKKGPADQLPESLVGMRGHEFHYYDSTCNGNVCTAGKPYRDTKWNCIVAGNNGIWGFPHFYYGSDSRFVDRFISRMKKMADR